MVSNRRQRSVAFVVPVLALVGNLGIKACQCPNSTPPIARTSHLSTDRFIEFSELGQGVFQGLGMVYLLTRIQRQILHAKVIPTLSPVGQNLFGGVSVTIYNQYSPAASLDLEVPFPIAMVVAQDFLRTNTNFCFSADHALKESLPLVSLYPVWNFAERSLPRRLNFGGPTRLPCFPFWIQSKNLS